MGSGTVLDVSAVMLVLDSPALPYFSPVTKPSGSVGSIISLGSIPAMVKSFHSPCYEVSEIKGSACEKGMASIVEPNFEGVVALGECVGDENRGEGNIGTVRVTGCVVRVDEDPIIRTEAAIDHGHEEVGVPTVGQQGVIRCSSGQVTVQREEYDPPHTSRANRMPSYIIRRAVESQDTSVCVVDRKCHGSTSRAFLQIDILPVVVRGSINPQVVSQSFTSATVVPVPGVDHGNGSRALS